MTTTEAIQTALKSGGFYKGTIDGIAGPITKQGVADWLASTVVTQFKWQKVRASSFADPADVVAFQRCKAKGKSDQECFKVGDNGIGKWGHLTAQDEKPMAAIPRDVWALVGKVGGAKLEVRYNGKTVQGILGDTLPHTANIKNGAGIDLNPAFAKQLGLEPPFMVDVEWRWV